MDKKRTQIDGEMFRQWLYHTAQKPWMIQPLYLEKMIQQARECAQGAGTIAESTVAFDFQPRDRGAEKAGAVSVIPLVGPISHRSNLIMEFFGGSSVQRFSKAFNQAVEDTSVDTILIDVDSPGGVVDGVPELANEIFNAREKKRVIAISNTIAASAAYWIGSAASEFVVTPSGEVGSIGVFVMHEDHSKMLEQLGVDVTLISAGKYKTEGNPFEPLSDSAREQLQSDVDAIYSNFLKSVARHRGVSVSTVRNDFGQGRTVMANDALKAGMVDRVATFADTLAKLTGGRGRGRRASVSEARRKAQVMELAEPKVI